MTDRNAWMYSSFGGSPVFTEEGELTSCHPDYGSKAAAVKHRTFIANLALQDNSGEIRRMELYRAAKSEWQSLAQAVLTLPEWLGMDEHEYAALEEGRATITSIVQERRSRI